MRRPVSDLSETHPTAVQTAHEYQHIVFGQPRCSCGFIPTGEFDGDLDLEVDYHVLREERAQAIRERDEAIELLRSVDEVWEPLTGQCSEDCDCLIHEARAFLSNFPEEDAE